MSKLKRQYFEESRETVKSRIPIIITNEPWEELNGELPLSNVIVFSSAPRKQKGHQVIERNSDSAEIVDFVSVRYARKRIAQKAINLERAAWWASFLPPFFVSARRGIV